MVFRFKIGGLLKKWIVTKITNAFLIIIQNIFANSTIFYWIKKMAGNKWAYMQISGKKTEK